jgi:hypothetical protein
LDKQEIESWTCSALDVQADEQVTFEQLAQAPVIGEPYTVVVDSDGRLRRKMLLHDLGKICKALLDVPCMAEALEEAMSIADAIDDPDQMVGSYKILVTQCLKQDNHSLAVQLTEVLVDRLQARNDARSEEYAAKLARMRTYLE